MLPAGCGSLIQGGDAWNSFRDILVLLLDCRRAAIVRKTVLSLAASACCVLRVLRVRGRTPRTSSSLELERVDFQKASPASSARLEKWAGAWLPSAMRLVMARISAFTAALPVDEPDDDARHPCLASTVCLVLAALAANCGMPVSSDRARGLGGTAGTDFEDAVAAAVEAAIGAEREDDMAITELARL